MKRVVGLAAFVLAVVAASAPASAALVVRDYKTAGDGLITYDDASGLEWLDLTATTSIMTSAALQKYSGFTLATQAQVQGLFTDAGIAIASGGPNWASPSPEANGLDMLSKFGTTIDFGFEKDFVGAFATDTPDRVQYVQLRVRSRPAAGVGSYAYNLGYTNNINSGFSTTGAFLVRPAQSTSAVPEPASWALLLAGFGLIGAMQRGRRWAERRA